MNKNAKLHLIAVSVGGSWLVGVSPSRGDEYTWQFAGSRQHSETGVVHEVDTSALSATYHFGSVDDSNGPYALAAFIDRSSRLTVSYTEDEAELVTPIFYFGPIAPPPSTSATSVQKSDGYSVSGRHIWGSGWFVGARASRADSDGSYWPERSAETLEVGKYVADSTTVELTAAFAESSIEIQFLQPCLPSAPFCISRFLRLAQETHSDDFGVAVFHVGELPNMHYAISGSVSSSRAELRTWPIAAEPFSTISPIPIVGIGFVIGIPAGETSLGRRQAYSVAGALYPTNAFGLRLGYQRSDGDFALDEAYDLTATWFFRRHIAVELMLARAKPDFASPDIETAEVRLIGRL